MGGVILHTKRSADAPKEVRLILNTWFDIVAATILVPNVTPDDPDPTIEANGPNGQVKVELSRLPQNVRDWLYAE